MIVMITTRINGADHKEAMLAEPLQSRSRGVQTHEYATTGTKTETKRGVRNRRGVHD